MNSFQVLLTRNLPGYNESILQKCGLCIHRPASDKNSFLDSISEFKSNGIKLHAIASCITDDLNGQVLKELSTHFPQCGLIANFGVGYNHIDMAVAKSLGIRVTNTPGVLTDATADIALALMLMTTRRLFEGAALMKSEGAFEGWSPDFMLSLGIQKKTVGIVGYGAIGQAFAKRVEVLGANVVVLETKRPQPKSHALLKEDDFLAHCDVISFHCKLTAETRGWLNEERLGKCKPGVVIVNTSRGEVIDECALSNALKSGKVSAAGLDVFCNEPVLSRELRDAPNLLVLPHLGSATFETRKAMSDIVVQNLVAFSKGERLLTEVF